MSNFIQPLALELELPWQIDLRQEEKFKKTLKRILIPIFILFVLVPFLPQFANKKHDIDERVVKTKVLLEPKVVEVIPPPPVEVPKPAPPEPVTPKEAKSEVKPVQKIIPTFAPKPVENKKESIAKSQGLTNLSSQLGALRNKLDITALQNKNVSDSSKGQVIHSDRQVLGKDTAMQMSAGIIVDDNVMRNSGAQLASHQSVEVDRVIQEGADFGDPDSNYLSYKRGKRDMESIRILLEQAKSRVSASYQRSLAENPDLAGNIRIELVIEPGGEVSDLKLLSGELGLEEVQLKLFEQIKQLDFGAKDVIPTRLDWTFVFIPS